MSTSLPPTDVKLIEIPSTSSLKPVFPSEIFGLVIASLPQSQLPIVAQVCRLFRDFGNPHLYRSVIINIQEDISPSPGGYRDGCGPDRIARFSSHILLALRAEKCHVDVGLTVSTSSPMEINRIEHTKVLTLTKHTYKKCQHLASLCMLNLETLRILNERYYYDVATDDTHLDFCSCSHFGTYKNNVRCIQNPACSCPLLVNLHPYRLIIGTESTGLYGSGLGLWSTSPLLPANITEVVVFVGEMSTAERESSSDPAMGLLLAVSDTVRRLTMVMTSWGGGLMEDMDGERWFPDDRDDDGDLSDTLAELLAIACCGEAQLVEIIGFETFPGQRWTEEELESEIGVVRMEMADILLKVGYEKEEAIRRADAVDFVTGKEYLERDGDSEMKGSRAAVVEAIKDYSEIWVRDMIANLTIVMRI